MADVVITKYDIVEIPKDALAEYWAKPWPDVWDAAVEGNGLDFQREASSERIHCEANRALLRRGPSDRTFLLRQNW